MSTKATVESAEKEVSGNYEYFKSMLPEWQHHHPHKFALLHKKKLVRFFESEHDALHTGIADYGLGCFSVQSVQNQPIDLGHQSNALF